MEKRRRKSQNKQEEIDRLTGGRQSTPITLPRPRVKASSRLQKIDEDDRQGSSRNSKKIDRTFDENEFDMPPTRPASTRLA